MISIFLYVHTQLYTFYNIATLATPLLFAITGNGRHGVLGLLVYVTYIEWIFVLYVVHSYNAYLTTYINTYICTP
jgi:hypothetical protein